MAIRDIIPTTNLTIDDVRDTLGAPATNNVGQLCTHAKINMFASGKPTRSSGDFSNDWQSGPRGDHSLLIPKWDGNVDVTRAAWSYLRPTGGSVSPYRLGDFRGYKHKARPMVTSGKYGTASYDFNIQLRPILEFSFDYSPNVTAGNVQAGKLSIDLEDSVAERTLADYIWAVRVSGSDGSGDNVLHSKTMFAGYRQTDGKWMYQRLRSGGTTIRIPMTADDIERMKVGTTATFFLIYPLTSATPPQPIAPEIIGGPDAPNGPNYISGKRVAVYTGVDASTGLNYLNPVPLTLSRSTGGVAVYKNPWPLLYDDTYVSVSCHSNLPLKVIVDDAGGILRSHNAPADGAVPYGENGNLVDIVFQTAPNTSINAREARVTLYTGSHPSMTSQWQQMVLRFTQAGAPARVTLTPAILTPNGMAGPTAIFALSAPSGQEWYILGPRSATTNPTPDKDPWITQITDVDTGTELVPDNPKPEYYYRGDKNIRLIVENNGTGAARTAYIGFSAGGNLTWLTVTQQKGKD